MRFHLMRYQDVAKQQDISDREDAFYVLGGVALLISPDCVLRARAVCGPLEYVPR